MKKLTIERTFDASIEKVWEAFTTPELLRKWWAPAGMTNTLVAADVKEGGLFRYCFKSDEDGTEYYGRGVYQKIDKPNYLSYLDCFTDKDGNDVSPSYYSPDYNADEEVVETLAEFFFTSDGEKTTIKLVGENPFDEEMTEMMTAGWNGMFDNLGKLK